MCRRAFLRRRRRASSAQSGQIHVRLLLSQVLVEPSLHDYFHGGVFVETAPPPLRLAEPVCLIQLDSHPQICWSHSVGQRVPCSCG